MDPKHYHVRPIAQADVTAFKVDPASQLGTLIANNLGHSDAGYYIVLETGDIVEASAFEAKYEETT